MKINLTSMSLNAEHITDTPSGKYFEFTLKETLKNMSFSITKIMGIIVLEIDSHIELPILDITTKELLNTKNYILK